MTGPLGMVLVGNGGTEQCHYPIASELVDRALVPVDLVHQDLEAALQDLVGFLGVEFLGYRGGIGNISEEDGNELAFALDGAAGREDVLGQVLRCIGRRDRNAKRAVEIRDS